MFDFECYGGWCVGDEVEEEDLNGGEWEDGCIFGVFEC